MSSQIDGNSLFHDNTIGSNSQIGGMVANLAIADALSKVIIYIYIIIFYYENTY